MASRQGWPPDPGGRGPDVEGELRVAAGEHARPLRHTGGGGHVSGGQEEGHA